MMERADISLKNAPAAPAQPSPDPIRAYKVRIAELRGYAAEDGFGLNPASEDDFRAFAAAAPGMRRAMLALPEEGNLSANWRDDGGNRASIEFLGNGKAEFVLRRSDGDAWDYGIDTLAGVTARISSFGLGSLVGV